MCEERHDEVKPVPTELEYTVERHVTSAAQREPRVSGSWSETAHLTFLA